MPRPRSRNDLHYARRSQLSVLRVEGINDKLVEPQIGAQSKAVVGGTTRSRAHAARAGAWDSRWNLYAEQSPKLTPACRLRIPDKRRRCPAGSWRSKHTSRYGRHSHRPGRNLSLKLRPARKVCRSLYRWQTRSPRRSPRHQSDRSHLPRREICYSGTLPETMGYCSLPRVRAKSLAGCRIETIRVNPLAAVTRIRADVN
jgi:hypothetical protein